MGPRSFERGNFLFDHAGQHVEQASMGPRSFERGNRSNRRPASPFKAACFNGAALIRARKCASWDEEWRVDAASMGPRSFERGNWLAGIGDPRQAPLQWGRAHSSAEMRWSTRLPARSQPLQWGRAHSSAEMLLDAADLDEVRYASMGPRSFERGNGSRIATPSQPPAASMGPRSFERGNRVWSVGLQQFVVASMGPRSFERGNPSSSKRHPGQQVFASMGPRSFERGNKALSTRAT